LSLHDALPISKARIKRFLLSAYSVMTLSKYDCGVSKAASLAISANVGGDNLACANFNAVCMISGFFDTKHPILAPHMLYLLDTESTTMAWLSIPASCSIE